MTTLLEQPAPAAPTADPTLTPGTNQMVTYTERVECPRCETVIPPDGVQRRPQTEQDKRAGLLSIAVYCPACRNGYEAVFALRSGMLHQASAIHLVTEPGVIESLRAGMDRARGNRQVRRPIPPEPTAQAVRAEPALTRMEAAALGDGEADPVARVERLLARFAVEMTGVVRELVAQRRVGPPPAAHQGVTGTTAAEWVAAPLESAPPAREPERTVDPSTSQVDDRPGVFELDPEKFAELRRARGKKG